MPRNGHSNGSHAGGFWTLKMQFPGFPGLGWQFSGKLEIKFHYSCSFLAPLSSAQLHEKMSLRDFQYFSAVPLAGIN